MHNAHTPDSPTYAMLAQRTCNLKGSHNPIQPNTSMLGHFYVGVQVSQRALTRTNRPHIVAEHNNQYLQYILCRRCAYASLVVLRRNGFIQQARTSVRRNGGLEKPRAAISGESSAEMLVSGTSGYQPRGMDELRLARVRLLLYGGRTGRQGYLVYDRAGGEPPLPYTSKQNPH